jgi:hypothetical protein
MASFIQDLEIAETAIVDALAFSNGQPFAATRKFGSITISVNIVKLLNGPAGTNYQVISGGLPEVISMAFGDIAGVINGVPLNIAEKIGNDWYGETVSLVLPAGSASAAVVAKATAPK